MYRSIFTFMNNRLQQFLELENITPARLADTLGVQRSGLSHILSGRNKPGYEFLTKLLHKFPHINSEWLLLGKGKPYKEMMSENGGSSSLPSAGNSRFGNRGNSMMNSGYPSQQPHQMYDSILSNSIQSNGIPYDIVSNNDIPYNIIPNKDIPYNGQQYDGLQYEDSAVFGAFGEISPEGTSTQNADNTTYNTDNLSNTSQNSTSQPSENCVNRQIRTTGGKNKQIKRVIVFYSDGSFEELFPHIR